ncbi:class II fructose-bisphosphate aldolase, partial [Streptomyces albogriseolus]|uniref:class II fructose-bisphosphate aldolase n=1 Tax=Streptomyces albogriseolus TaxID=1887 RepID=UPI0036C7B695
GPAARAGLGGGAFSVGLEETAVGKDAGAEAAGRPVILQISENTARYHGGLEPIGLATLAVARAALVPVAVHLDHAESVNLVHEAVRLGFSSVMFDASTLPYKENLRATREVAEYCHARDVWVEAELGEVGGKDGAHAPGVRTDPAQARDFVAATGVDALAVAVGSSHAMTTRDAVL